MLISGIGWHFASNYCYMNLGACLAWRFGYRVKLPVPPPPTWDGRSPTGCENMRECPGCLLTISGRYRCENNMCLHNKGNRNHTRGDEARPIHRMSSIVLFLPFLLDGGRSNKFCPWFQLCDSESIWWEKCALWYGILGRGAYMIYSNNLG